MLSRLGNYKAYRLAGYIPTKSIKQIRSKRSWSHSEVIMTGGGRGKIEAGN